MHEMQLALIVLFLIFLVYWLMPKKEKMVSEMNWLSMARGLNASNSNGYNPVITTLSDMERTNAAGIQAT